MDKITVPRLHEMKKRGEKIVTLTTYDYSTTKILDQAGIDVLLIGDSLGMVKLGYSSTLPVTVEDMLYHTRVVARAGARALIVTDMPYMSYQTAPSDAVRHAGAMMKAGAQAVKIEGGIEMVPVVRALVKAKIPVMGHLGLTPQSVHVFGGYKVQGRKPAQSRQILKDAKALQNAGAFAIVLECIPTALAKRVTRSLRIPTIGIGAGKDCDGQVLVIDDVLGLTAPPHPRFVKAYADLRAQIGRAARAYVNEVRRGKFPGPEHGYS